MCVRPYLLHEEVVHAPVVVGAGEDLQRVVLPLGGLQSRAADLHAAPPLHLGRRLFVLLQLSEHAVRHQVRAAWRRHVLLTCRVRKGMKDLSRTKRPESGKSRSFRSVDNAPSPSSGPVSPSSPSRESDPQISFSLDVFFSPYFVLLQKRILRPLIRLLKNKMETFFDRCPNN